MIKQNINIVGVPILYNILEEIKENLSFKIENFTKLDDFLNFFNKDKSENKNFFIITTISNKDFFINKIKLEKKNIFFLCHKNSKVDINHNYNVFKYIILVYKS